MFMGGGGRGKPKNDPRKNKKDPHKCRPIRRKNVVKRLQHGEQVAKRPPDNEIFFSKGGGGRTKAYSNPPPPPPPMRAPMSIYICMFFKRMFSENVLQDAPN